MPTTTVDDGSLDDDLTTEVFDAYDRAIASTLLATEDPFDSAREQAALELRTIANQTFLTSLLADLRERGLSSRTNPELPAYRYPMTPATLSTDGTGAHFDVCEIDSQILVLETAEGPEDLNDDIIPRRETVEMVFVEGAWRLNNTIERDSFPGQLECAR